MAITKKIGNSSKNSTYLALMKGNIAHDPRHPRNMGVKMQAHHVISATGVALSHLGERLEKFGYDINLEKNLVFIPCTLQGACYLGVQPHRGNHTAPGRKERAADEDDYDDDADSRSYHKLVADMLIDEEREFPKKCKKNEIGKNSVVKQLDDLARVILDLIQNAPREAPLTDVAKHFKRGAKIGCGGHDSVSGLRDQPSACAVERNHKKNQRQGQREEKISFISDGKYQLSMGK